MTETEAAKRSTVRAYLDGGPNKARPCCAASVTR